MRRAPKVSPPPVGEARVAPMPFACWRAHSSERVAEPQPECPFIFARLTFDGNGVCELRAGFHSLPDRLPGNASMPCSITKSGTPSQVRQDRRITPVPVHGLEISLNRRCRPVSEGGIYLRIPCGLACGDVQLHFKQAEPPAREDKKPQLHLASPAHPRSCAGGASTCSMTKPEIGNPCNTL
jgi:hypothetical protein